MTPFRPKKIFIDQDVKDTEWTQNILNYFSGIPHEIVPDQSFIKKPQIITDAKKYLFITKHKGEIIKSCQGMGDYVCCNYLTVSFMSNCHLECSYCILQDYLKNNPVITFYANPEEIIEAIDQKIKSNSQQIFRVGTGELADSLALDPIFNYTKTLVPYAAKQKNLIIELKTKSNQIEQLFDLEHNGRTVVSWSINPQNFINQEEAKTSSLEERLVAARKIADHGYPIAFHLDPLLALPNWEEEYKQLILHLRSLFKDEELAWLSIGSLRFTKDLKDIATSRFPKSKIFYGEIIPSQDGKMRYFRDIRQELYSHVKALLEENFPDTVNYLCMETKTVWKKIFGENIPEQMELEEKLSRKFAI